MEALIGQYYIDGYLETGDAGFNSHNQYLDTWIGLGLVGVLLLLSLIAIPIIAGFKYGYLPLILYGVALIVGFVTEVMFTHSTGDFSITLIMMLMIMSAIEKVNATKSLSVTVERT
jgi:O-antigen ligase